jgi:hypothetical protein
MVVMSGRWAVCMLLFWRLGPPIDALAGLACMTEYAQARAHHASQHSDNCPIMWEVAAQEARGINYQKVAEPWQRCEQVAIR